MNEPQRIAKRHRHTRKDHASETAEDYVEAVFEIIESAGACRVVDLAKRFDVSHVTVTRIISRLQKEGYVTTEPYRPIELTSSGQKLAKDSKARHDIVFNFLVSLGVPNEIAEIDAEGLEHHVSDQTLKIFQQYLKKQSND